MVSEPYRTLSLTCDSANDVSPRMYFTPLSGAMEWIMLNRKYASEKSVCKYGIGAGQEDRFLAPYCRGRAVGPCGIEFGTERTPTLSRPLRHECGRDAES